ncbi:MAG TPA: type II toxin-antitoxin system Phd/YefM family antitoxin [Thermodesulfobacteriota bacterium]|nr:type II toxin-antitoxin system Phd/YefM family antitoxin [Thermodesulfobacteriota bacterium]
MKIYTYSEARQKLALLLEEAQKEGSVGIRRRDGSTFILKPSSAMESPLDVEGVDTGITAREIVGFIHEGRKRYDNLDD